MSHFLYSPHFRRLHSFFSFVRDHVFIPYRKRTYADPHEMWALLHACLHHFHFALELLHTTSLPHVPPVASLSPSLSQVGSPAFPPVTLPGLVLMQVGPYRRYCMLVQPACACLLVCLALSAVVWGLWQTALKGSLQLAACQPLHCLSPCLLPSTHRPAQ